MNRDKKLKRLEYEKAAKEMQVTMSGTALLDTMDKVEELKEALGLGIDLNNIDELVSQLKEVQSLTPEVKKLEEAIKSLDIPEMPESVSIKGLDSLIEVTKALSNKKEVTIEPVTAKSFEGITKRLDTLIQKVQSSKVSEPSQDADNFVPMRRVIKAGNVFIYDDFVGGAGGGGSSSGGGAVTQGTTPWITSQDTALLSNQQTTITSSTAETTIVTADATYKLDLYGLILTNTSATATKVTIKDSTTGTTRMVFQVPATDTRGFMLPADSGHKQATVNNNWTATCGTSVASIEITALFNKR